MRTGGATLQGGCTYIPALIARTSRLSAFHAYDISRAQGWVKVMHAKLLRGGYNSLTAFFNAACVSEPLTSLLL
jgi:hypothetical protein